MKDDISVALFSQTHTDASRHMLAACCWCSNWTLSYVAQWTGPIMLSSEATDSFSHVFLMSALNSPYWTPFNLAIPMQSLLPPGTGLRSRTL
ncbi:hypothetical protein SKAU_G00023640 [Synaphobranchus kaupii]|uniref:Uncharacterized protein n=1 Tax=Synaphobranchus kaupii TaxID=118154 RepID=A0A9Q1GC97_SYNKA|nr:hypothetical protein SKAU_G00023640 [Synaphobranchus kaupii]